MANVEGEFEREAALDRMLTRLALTDDSKLESVLSKLLPYVISCLSSSLTSVRQKVMEILKHINRRVKDQPTIQLPVMELWKLFKSSDSIPMVKNFAIIYIEMAFNRLPLEDKLNTAPEILPGLSKLPVQHQDILLRIIVEVMEYHSEKLEETIAKKYRMINNMEELNVFIAFCLQTILYYSPPSISAGLYCPAGLSARQVQRVRGKCSPSGEQLTKRKVGILNVIESMNLPAEIVYPLYLAASIDSQETVARRGEQLFKRKAANANLEDDRLMGNLFSLFQGTPNDENIGTEEKISPASLPLKIQLMSSFCHSIKAANSFPATLQCIFDCIYGGSSNLKLKRAGMEFTVWVFKHASLDQLKLMGPIILSGILKFLDSYTIFESDSSTRELKEFAYQAIGLLSQRLPQHFRENIDMATRLFQAVREEEPSCRFVVQEAVNTVAAAYKECSEKVLREIEVLLLKNSQAVETEARRCALHWATTLYSLEHCPSRYICMLMTADANADIREMAIHGLFPQKTVDRVVTSSSHLRSERYPPLHEMLNYIIQQKPEMLHNAEIRETKLLFPARMYIEMIRFCLKCFEANTENVNTNISHHHHSVISLCLLVEHAMVSEGPFELHSVASKALLDVAFQCQMIVAVHLAEDVSWLKQYLSHMDYETRVNVSRLLGITSSALSTSSTSVLIKELCCTFEIPSKHRFEDNHGAICATGYVVAHCFTGNPMVSHVLLETCILLLVDIFMSSNLPLAATAAEALGHIALREFPFSSSIFQLQDSFKDAEKDALTENVDVVPLSSSKYATNASNEIDEEGALYKLKLQHRKASLNDIANRYKELLSSDDKKIVQKVAISCGHVCYRDSSLKFTDMVIDMLFNLTKSKVEDVLYSVGEAFAFIWGIIPITVDEILKSSYTSLSTSTNYLMGGITSHPSIDNMVTPTTISTDSHSAVKEKIIDTLFSDLLYSHKKEERLAGSILLLSLVSYCGCHPRLKQLLPEIQEAFSYLLGDQNETTQEIASRGMSIIYDLGDASTKSDLVKALVNTLTGTAKRKKTIKLEGDSEVFEDGTIGERPGGGKLSTYKELCSLANEMGQPDLIYRFMDLANYQAMMNSKRGAAFGFSKIAKQAGDALKPYLRSLVPKLVRYQYDPDKMIQDAMGHIWRSLVDQPKKTIDEYWNDVIEELLTQSGSRLWRARESSCLALADLLQGRKFDQVGKYLRRIWVTTFRAMDDIKETVRNAGERLCRAILSLSSRLCDTSLTDRDDAKKAIAIILPFMLSDGIVSKVSIVQKVAINMVTKLSKSAGDVIRPHLPELIYCMLESLSSLEDQNLNYAELHAESVGIQKEKFQSLRIAVANESPMWETLSQSIKYIDDSTLESVVPRLVQLVRTGVGLNTRVGVAKFICLLVQKVGLEIKPFVPAFSRVLLPAVQGEKSIAAKKAFAAACGCLLKFAGPSQAEKIIHDAISLYISSEDKEVQIASAILLQSFSHEAADVLKKYHVMVLPLLFIARFDDDREISRLIEDVWEENSTGESVTLQLYLQEIVLLLNENLTSSSWAKKKKSYRATKVLAETLGRSLSPYVQDLLKTVLKEIPGRIWEGKEEILDATAALVEACHDSVITDDSVNQEAIVTAMVSACSKKQKSFRNAAFLNLEKIIKAFGKPEIFEMVVPFLVQVCNEAFEDRANNILEMVETHADSPRYDSFAFEKSLDSITAALNTANTSAVLAKWETIVMALVNALQPVCPWKVKLCAFPTIQMLYKRVSHVTAGFSDPSNAVMKRISESFHRLFPLTSECIKTTNIAKVHVAASECLLDMIEVYCLPDQQIELSIYDELSQLYNMVKDQSAKLILKKSLEALDILKNSSNL